VDAIGVAVFSVGAFLTYSAIKGLHPWALFTQTLSASVPVAIAPGTPSQPGQTGFGAAVVPVSSTGVAQGTK
jgi:hypothetical protein